MKALLGILFSGLRWVAGHWHEECMPLIAAKHKVKPIGMCEQLGRRSAPYIGAAANGAFIGHMARRLRLHRDEILYGTLKFSTSSCCCETGGKRGKNIVNLGDIQKGAPAHRASDSAARPATRVPILAQNPL
jgi:hypothetical protein